MAKIERIFTEEKWEVYNQNHLQCTFRLNDRSPEVLGGPPKPELDDFDYEFDITLPEEIFTLASGPRKEAVLVAQKDPKTSKYKLRRGGVEKLVRSDELMRMLTYVAKDPFQYLEDM